MFSDPWFWSLFGLSLPPPKKMKMLTFGEKLCLFLLEAGRYYWPGAILSPLESVLDSSMSLWFISPIFLLAKDSSPAVALIQAYIFKAKLLLNLFNDAFFSAYFCVFVSRWHVFISCKSRSPIKTCFMQISLFFFPLREPFTVSGLPAWQKPKPWVHNFGQSRAV